jgi:cytochrome c553
MTNYAEALAQIVRAESAYLLAVKATQLAWNDLTAARAHGDVVWAELEAEKAAEEQAKKLCARCHQPEGDTPLTRFVVGGLVGWHEGCAADFHHEHERDEEPSYFGE